MLQRNIPLNQYSHFKIGGPAKYFREFLTREGLKESFSEWKELNHGGLGNYFVLGGGTNVVFRDEGFDGLVLKNSIDFGGREDEDDLFIQVGAGSSLESLVDSAVRYGLSGLEWAGGLPGTVGGAIRGNAGAFGGETKDNLEWVESFDPKTFEFRQRSNEECKFSYRTSVFKKGDGEGEVIVSARFSFTKGDTGEIEKLTLEKANYRRERHPLEFPNVGSIFKNVDWDEVPENLKKEFEQYIKKDPFPVLPTAKLLSLANLKGLKIGGAMVSEKHPNFIVNVDKATAQDVKNLIAKIKDVIKKEYGISLEEEVYCL